MYLDIDSFKQVNDSWGHDVGDWVLVELARRLAPIMRPTDTLARLGGDEFVAVFEDITKTSDIDIVAARMVAALDTEWVLNGRTLPITVSIGVAVADATTQDAAALLRAADAAMYRAKKQPGSGWVVASTEPASL